MSGPDNDDTHRSSTDDAEVARAAAVAGSTPTAHRWRRIAAWAQEPVLAGLRGAAAILPAFRRSRGGATPPR